MCVCVVFEFCIYIHTKWKTVVGFNMNLLSYRLWNEFLNENIARTHVTLRFTTITGSLHIVYLAQATHNERYSILMDFKSDIISKIEIINYEFPLSYREICAWHLGTGTNLGRKMSSENFSLYFLMNTSSGIKKPCGWLFVCSRVFMFESRWRWD